MANGNAAALADQNNGNGREGFSMVAGLSESYQHVPYIDFCRSSLARPVLATSRVFCMMTQK